MNVIISSMMNLLVFATIIGLNQAFPTEKILDIDKTPCHAEALEVRTTKCILKFSRQKSTSNYFGAEFNCFQDHFNNVFLKVFEFSRQKSTSEPTSAFFWREIQTFVINNKK